MTDDTKHKIETLQCAGDCGVVPIATEHWKQCLGGCGEWVCLKCTVSYFTSKDTCCVCDGTMNTEEEDEFLDRHIDVLIQRGVINTAHVRLNYLKVIMPYGILCRSHNWKSTDSTTGCPTCMAGEPSNSNPNMDDYNKYGWVSIFG